MNQNEKSSHGTVQIGKNTQVITSSEGNPRVKILQRNRKKEKLCVAHPIRVFSSWGITILIFTFTSGKEREPRASIRKTRRGKLREGEQTSHPTKARLETPKKKKKLRVQMRERGERRKMLCKSVL